METILREKITNELLNEVLYISQKHANKWIVTNTIARYVVVVNSDERGTYLLKHEYYTEETKSHTICKLVTVQDIQDIIEVLVRLDAIHDLYKDEEGQIKERDYNIKEKISNYYLSRRGRL